MTLFRAQLYSNVGLLHFDLNRGVSPTATGNKTQLRPPFIERVLPSKARQYADELIELQKTRPLDNLKLKLSNMTKQDITCAT